MRRIHVDAKDIPDVLKVGHTYKTYTVVICESYTVPATAGMWDGGSRAVFRLIRLSDGMSIPISDNNTHPANGSRKDVNVKLEDGFVLVCHTIFCGKDLGVTFYVHPHTIAGCLPLPVQDELSEQDKIVLYATRALKSSYNGKDRYELMMGELCYSKEHMRFDRATWDKTKASLMERGLLMKNGALTTKGRNAAEGLRY